MNTPSSKGFFSLFPMIGLPVFVAFLEQTIVASALPAMAEDFGDLTQVAWVIVVYLASVAIAAPIYGRLGDAYGRRRMLLIALSIAACGAVCCALAGSIGWLIAARIMQGLGAGGLLTLTQAMISEAVPVRERARYHGYLAMTAVVATGLGPIIGGFLTSAFGWQSIFLFYLPLIAGALVLARLIPGSPPDAMPLRLDLVGIALVAISVGGLLVSIELLRRSVDAPAPGLSLLAASAAGFALLAWWQHVTSDPLISPDLVRHPTIWRGCVLAMCQGGVLLSLLSFLPIMLRVVFAASPGEIGLLMIPVSFCLGLGAWVTGQLVSRTGRTALFPLLGFLFAGILLCGLGLLLDDFNRWAMSLYLSAIALGLGMIMAVVLVIVPETAGPGRFGTASAIVQLARTVGSAVGTALTSTIIVLVATGGDGSIAGQLSTVLQGGSAGDGIAAGMQVGLMNGLSAALFMLSAISFLGAFFAWRLPSRRI